MVNIMKIFINYSIRRSRPEQRKNNISAWGYGIWNVYKYFHNICHIYDKYFDDIYDKL